MSFVLMSGGKFPTYILHSFLLLLLPPDILSDLVHYNYLLNKFLTKLIDRVDTTAYS